MYSEQEEQALLEQPEEKQTPSDITCGEIKRSIEYSLSLMTNYYRENEIIDNAYLTEPDERLRNINQRAYKTLDIIDVLFRDKIERAGSILLALKSITDLLSCSLEYIVNNPLNFPPRGRND